MAIPRIARTTATATPISQLRAPKGGLDGSWRISLACSAETNRLTITPRRINAVPIQRDSPVEGRTGATCRTDSISRRNSPNRATTNPKPHQGQPSPYPCQKCPAQSQTGREGPPSHRMSFVPPIVHTSLVTRSRSPMVPLWLYTHFSSHDNATSGRQGIFFQLLGIVSLKTVLCEYLMLADVTPALLAWGYRPSTRGRVQKA